MFKNFKNNQGFTILELTIAVGVMLAVFSAIGGFMNRVIPDFMIISILNEESQYARSITQLLAREIKKANTGIPKKALSYLRPNKKLVVGSNSIILPVMILDTNNNYLKPLDSGGRIWIADEASPKITNYLSKGDPNKNVYWIEETATQEGKIYSVNNEGLLVYQTAQRSLSYEVRVKDDEFTIFTNKSDNKFVVDKTYIVALPGTKNQLESLKFTRKKARVIDDIGVIFDEVYTIELAMNTKTTYDREFKYATTIEASVSPMTVRARIASGTPLAGG